jgi:hypothetical protein
VPVTPELPAYFLGGPHDTEMMYIGGAPLVFQFPVPPSLELLLKSLTVEEMCMPLPMRADDYNLVRPVLLYKYAGRFPR